MVKLWKEQTDLKKVTDRVYPTTGKDEVRDQVDKARKSKPAKDTKEVVENIKPKKYPNLKGWIKWRSWKNISFIMIIKM